MFNMFDMSLRGITNSLNLEIHISPLHPMDLFHSLISPNFVTLNKTFVQKIYKRLYFNLLLNSVLMGGIFCQDEIHHQNQTEPGPKTILSGMHVAEQVELADGFLFHIVPVIVSGNTAFVTVAFHHSDGLKVSADGRQMLETRTV